MNKTIKFFGVVLIFLVALTAVHAEKSKPSCSDSDGGMNIWTGGTLTYGNNDNNINLEDKTNKQKYVDVCAGESNNLKEYYCPNSNDNENNLLCDREDDHTGAFKVINCEDYNAVCVSGNDDNDNNILSRKDKDDSSGHHDNAAAYCACQEGYSFNAEEKTCVKDGEVPEFGVIAGGLALLAGIGIVAYRRK